MTDTNISFGRRLTIKHGVKFFQEGNYARKDKTQSISMFSLGGV